MAAVCREFGMSRKTSYKLVQRYFEEGPDGLKDRSRAPHHHPQAVSQVVERAVVSARSAHPTWGPKKLRAWLQRQEATVTWPAASTIGRILSRHGLCVPRRRSRKTRVYEEPFVGCETPNAVWSADLKGWFTTGDGIRCDPLTITDNYSRFLLRCQAVSPADTGQSSRSLRPPSASMACRWRFVPTMDHRLRLRPWAVCPGCRSGGSSSASSPNALSRVNRRRMVAMSVCTAPSSRKRPRRPSAPGDGNSRPFTAFAENTTKSVPMKRSANDPPPAFMLRRHDRIH